MIMIYKRALLLVLLIAVSNSKEMNNKTVLTISVLLPLSSPQLDGRAYLPALDLALELINTRTDILPDYRLEADVSDSACSAGASVRSFINHIFNPPIKVGMIGPICSTATQPVAELANYWNLVMISAGASNPKLSDPVEYPTLLRTVSADTAVVDGIIALMKFNDWSRIACITQQEFLFTTTYSLLSESIISNTLSESRNFQFGTDDNPQAEVEKLHNSPFRIIFLNMYPIKAIEVICQAHELGMTLDNGYVWLTYAWYGSDWWTRGSPLYNCSLEKRQSFVKGTLSIDHFPFVEEERHNETTHLGLSLSEYYTQYYEILNTEYSDLADSIGRFTIPFTPLFVDAIWTLALALHRSEIDSSDSLYNFTYESSDMAKRIFKEATEVQFEGVTLVYSIVTGQLKPIEIEGLVSFQNNGDRNGYVRFFQLRDNTSSTGHLVSVPVAILSNNTFTYNDGESHSKVFPDGVVPEDELIDNVEPWLFGCCAVLACIGIGYALCCLIFNLVFSEKKVIKMSSPYLNILIVVGAIMFYIDVILFGLDKTYVSETIAELLCMVTVWVATIAFSLLFGTIFVKTWRVYYIFHVSSQRKKNNKVLINDGFLFVLIGILLLIDVIFLLTITIVPSTRLKLKTQELASSDNSLPVEVCLCTATNKYIWLGVLLAYKGILLTVGVFLAFETRKVKIHQLNDSHLIGMCVYAIVVLSIALCPIGILLDTHVDMFYGIIGSMVLFGTTLILSLLFVPKFYSLIRDPSGEVVITTSNGTNGMTLGVDEKMNAEYLRQEIDKLKLELAKNRKVSAVGVSLSSLTSNGGGSRSYTISQVVKTHRVHSGSDANISPQHQQYI